MPPADDLLRSLRRGIPSAQDELDRLRASLGLRPRRQRLPRGVIEQVASQEGGGILASIGNALAVPGDLLRGVITGRAGERVEPRELLATLGIEPEAEFDLTNLTPQGFAAGLGVLATDIATDPLSLLAGIGQLGKAPRAIAGAQEAATAARSFSRIGRRVGTGRTGSGATGRVGRNVQSAARARRPELADLIRGERTRARELLESIPQRLRPADLFRGGRPQIQRIVPARAGTATAQFQASRGGLDKLLPRTRELATAGIPFTRARGRIPVLPRALEQAALRPLARGGAAARRGLQRTFGRGIPEATRAGFRFFRTDVRKTAEEIGQEIGREAGRLVDERVAAAVARSGGSPDDVIDAVRDQFQVDIRNAREGKASLLKVEEREFAKDLNQIVDGATDAQIATGARNDALIENYAERILTKEGREEIRRRRLSNSFRQFMNQRARISDGSQIRRREYLRDKFTTDVNDFFAQNMPDLQGQNFFNLDPAVTVEAAIRDRGMSVIQANLVSSLVNDFAGMAGRAGDVPIAQFLAKIGLNRFRGASWSKTGSVDAVEKALQAAGIDVTQTIPMEIAKEAGDVVGVLGNTSTGAWRGFLDKVYDPIASVYRAGATTPFPGFHLRNQTGNMILNAMAGVRNPIHYAKAFREFFNPTEQLRLQKLGVVRGGWSRAILEDAQRSGLKGGNLAQRMAEFGANNPVSRQMGKLGDFVENTSRMAHFYGKKAGGLSDIQSVNSVNKFLFNYGRDALAPFERGVANRLFFFYRWNRYALPLVMGQLFENPARFAALGRLTTQPATDRPAGIPEFVREAAGIPGTTDPTTGETTFTTKFGSPFEVLSLVDPLDAVGVQGVATETAREVSANLLPPLRAALEIFAGEEFFLGQDISGLDQGSALGSRIGEQVSRIPGLEQFGKDIGEEVLTRRPGVTRNRRAPALRFIERNLPTARLTQTLTRLADAAGESINVARGEPSGQRKRRTLGEEFLRTGLGVNFADVDTEEEAVNRFRRVLNRQAEAARLEGKAGELEIPFISEEGKLDPETRQLFDLLNRIRGRRRL